MKRNNIAVSALLAFSSTLFCFAADEIAVPDQPSSPSLREVLPPVIHVVDLRADEKPIAVERVDAVVEDNGFFRRVRTTFTFTNPNLRAMAGELEFPIPDGASICGYSLEVNGEMVPGVVCEKEKARVAFENEVRKGVDPGIVEQVKGNIWKTRIFPLSPNVPRKAEVDYVAPKSANEFATAPVFERDCEDIFVAEATGAVAAEPISAKIAAFAKGTVVWDASMSAKPFAATWRGRLAALPEKGEWSLVVFRHAAEAPRIFASRDELLAAIDAIVYDGGTSIGAAIDVLGLAVSPLPVLLFTDEIDTMGLSVPGYEDMPGVTVASRDDVPVRSVSVRRLAKGEALPEGVEARQSTLLATVWAARRMQDLASQSDSRKDEFLALGRKYGVAGPGLSLIVLETLEQWLEHKIEPPANLAIHDEWVRRRAADDDPIADKKARAEHEKELLEYWEERVKWWNDPKPPKKTPKSGLFDSIARVFRSNDGDAAPADAVPEVAAAGGGRRLGAERRASASSNASAESEEYLMEEPMALAKDAASPGAAASGHAPTVTLKEWDPKTPYLDVLKSAAKGETYSAYLAEREKHGSSPAFYLDCAGWFFKAGEREFGERILSNLAEFKLEDAVLWRSMGWRAREAGSYDLAILAFRKVLALRGEEAQSRRDLALVLCEKGKSLAAANPGSAEAKAALEEAMSLFADAAFEPRSRRSGRRGNDFQVSVIALEELNGLVSWVDSISWPEGAKPAVVEFDAAYRRDLPVKLRIVMSWDADETDIDLHVLEPNGEEAYYGNRRTAEGGFVSQDVTTGYGPEEYLKKDLEPGSYKVLSNYFASHQTALTGATTVTATVYTDWGTADEKRQVLTMRLDKPKSKHLIGEVAL